MRKSLPVVLLAAFLWPGLAAAVFVGLTLEARPAPDAGPAGPSNAAARRGNAPPRAPNLLLISIDTLRADALGCYGGRAARTPAVDGLARRGVLFERAFAHAPLTLPSHASILTGTLPMTHGIHDNLGFRLSPDAVTLAGHLRLQGFATAAFVGAFPLDSRFGLGLGFDLYDDLYGSADAANPMVFVERRAGEVTARSMDWIETRRGGPWFVFLHLFDPHQPYAPPEPYASRYAADPYAGEVAYVDACLAELMGQLDAAGAGEDTVIVLTSDHGEAFGEHGETSHGYFAYNGTLRVPLIVGGAAARLGGRRVADAVSHVDIFPTVCDLLGVPPPPGLAGRSLRPLMDGQTSPERPIYFESVAAFHNCGWAPLRGVVDGGFKFIDQPVPELYDLGADFAEASNLAGRRPLDAFRKMLADFTRAAPPGAEASRKGETRAAEEKMRSLGYLAGAGAGSGRAKGRFSEADDLKTNLRWHQRLTEAARLYGRGETDAAVRVLEELVAAKPDFPTAREYLANLRRERREWAAAAAVLRAGLALAPEHVRMRGLLGLTLSESGDQEAAVEELARAVEASPEDAELWNYLGVAQWKSGRLDQAEKSYGKALALDVNDANVINNLGALELSRKNPAAAERRFDRALGLDPNLASAWNGRGVARSMTGDPAGAVLDWEKALALEPGHLMALYNLGTALIRRGRPTEALERLERYLREAPADAPDRPEVEGLVKALRGRASESDAYQL